MRSFSSKKSCIQPTPKSHSRRNTPTLRRLPLIKPCKYQQPKQHLHSAVLRMLAVGDGIAVRGLALLEEQRCRCVMVAGSKHRAGWSDWELRNRMEELRLPAWLEQCREPGQSLPLPGGLRALTTCFGRQAFTAEVSCGPYSFARQPSGHSLPTPVPAAAS